MDILNYSRISACDPLDLHYRGSEDVQSSEKKRYQLMQGIYEYKAPRFSLSLPLLKQLASLLLVIYGIQFKLTTVTYRILSAQQQNRHT